MMMGSLKTLALLCVLAVSFGCMGNEGKASDDDKANLDRLSREGLVPQGTTPTPATRPTEGKVGEPVSGPVSDP
jgi:hypothetical protein